MLVHISGKVIFSDALCCKSNLPSEGLKTNAENARWSKPLLIFSIRWPEYECKKTISFKRFEMYENTDMSSYPLRQWHCLPHQRGYTFRPSTLIVLDHNSIGPRSREQLGQRVRQVKTWYDIDEWFGSIICLVWYALRYALLLVRGAKLSDLFQGVSSGRWSVTRILISFNSNNTHNFSLRTDSDIYYRVHFSHTMAIVNRSYGFFCSRWIRSLVASTEQCKWSVWQRKWKVSPKQW